MAGKTLEELAGLLLLDERPVGIVIEEEQIIAMAIAAARFCAGFGPIESLIPPPPDPDPNEAAISLDYTTPLVGGYGYPIPGYPLSPQIVAGSPIAPVDWIDKDTVITQSEWAAIRPLFLLYVERENALYLESSRVQGVDVYGRSSAEISQDIAAAEDDPRLPQRMFIQPIISV